MRAAISMAAAMIVAGGASANTVTFQGGVYVGGDAPYGTYVEDGVTVTPDEESREVNGHLDDGGTGEARHYSLTMERPFSAVSFDIRPFDFDPRLCSDTDWTCVPAPYENVLVEGYLDGERVAMDTFNMYDVSPPFAFSTYTFGAAFNEIDALFIGFTPIPYDAPSGYTFQCGYPCSHYTVTNITLTPIPLPASGVLLAGAVAAVGVARRRRAYLRGSGGGHHG